MSSCVPHMALVLSKKACSLMFAVQGMLALSPRRAMFLPRATPEAITVLRILTKLFTGI